MSCVLLTYSLDGKTLPVEVLLLRQFDVSEYFTNLGEYTQSNPEGSSYNMNQNEVRFSKQRMR